MVNPIEGDFIETTENFIFDVKGLSHPKDRVIAFLRYFPDSKGDRVRKKTKSVYRKVYTLTERYSVLKTLAPHYLYDDPISRIQLQAVPLHAIKRVYHPSQCLKHLRKKTNLSSLQTDAVNAINDLKQDSEVPWRALGVTGSILVGLETDQSDLDLIVYGKRHGKQIMNSVTRLCSQTKTLFQKYTLHSIKNLINHRWGSLPQFRNVLTKIEMQKKLQGFYNKREFFIRVLSSDQPSNQVYEEIQFKPLKIVTISGIITDATNNFVTPCSYTLSITKSDPPLINGQSIEVISFRGRFTEHAIKDDHVRVQGKLEHIQAATFSGYRIMLGNSPDDFMLPEG